MTPSVGKILKLRHYHRMRQAAGGKSRAKIQAGKETVFRGEQNAMEIISRGLYFSVAAGRPQAIHKLQPFLGSRLQLLGGVAGKNRETKITAGAAKN
jgi:hypothetical protein